MCFLPEARMRSCKVKKKGDKREGKQRGLLRFKDDEGETGNCKSETCFRRSRVMSTVRSKRGESNFAIRRVLRVCSVIARLRKRRGEI